VTLVILDTLIVFTYLLTGGGAWRGGSAPSPKNVLDFASQMATLGAFLALSFTVWMDVLHIKSSALDLKSAAKFTNWGFELPEY